MTAIGLGVVVGVLALGRPELRSRARPFLAGLAVAAGVAGLLLAYPLYVQFFGPGAYSGLSRLIRGYSSDLASFVAYSRESLAGSPRTAGRPGQEPDRGEQLLRLGAGGAGDRPGVVDAPLGRGARARRARVALRGALVGPRGPLRQPGYGCARSLGGAGEPAHPALGRADTVGVGDHPDRRPAARLRCATRPRVGPLAPGRPRADPLRHRHGARDGPVADRAHSAARGPSGPGAHLRDQWGLASVRDRWAQCGDPAVAGHHLRGAAALVRRDPAGHAAGSWLLPGPGHPSERRPSQGRPVRCHAAPHQQLLLHHPTYRGGAADHPAGPGQGGRRPAVTGGPAWSSSARRSTRPRCVGG